MKILITGYTSRMTGSDRLRRDYVTFSFLLEDILREMGHTVERRKVIIPEKIAYVYDYAFCGVAPLSSITSGQIPETHYVMDRLPGRHAVYADDWSFCAFGKSVRYTLDKWDRFVEYKSFPYKKHQLDETLNSLTLLTKLSAHANAPVLVPMFPWGDHQILMKGNYSARLVPIDPSCFLKFPSITTYPASLKDKKWVMAALSNHTPWIKRQNFKLPVTYVGNVRLNGVVLSEAETVQLFAKSWGALSVEYPSAGSGWWRTRYLNSAWAETLIYSGSKDASIMGKPYQGTPAEFEDLSNYEYKVRVEEQSDWLEKNVATRNQTIKVIERLISK